MNSSQLTRLKNEAANIYLARNKSVDSSLLTFKIQQRAAYAGAARFKTPPYYKGNPIQNPILYDISSCPIDHSFKDGYTSVTELSQQGTIAMERGGAAICCDADYSKVPAGIFLLSPSTCSTILTSYNNNTPKTSVPAILSQIYNIPRYVFPKNLPSLSFEGNSFVACSIDTYYSGSSDFTMEFYVKPSGLDPLGSIQTLFYIGAGSIADTYKFMGTLVASVPGKKYGLVVQVSTLGTLRAGELEAGAWSHIAVIRYNNTMYIYVNGTLLGKIEVPVSGIPGSSSVTTYLSDPPSSTSESLVILGAAYNFPPVLNNGFYGNLTSFAFTKGNAKYNRFLDGQIIVPNVFQPDSPTIKIGSYSAYTSILLQANSSSTLLINNGTPVAAPDSQVSITDGNTISGTFDPLIWAIV